MARARTTHLEPEDTPAGGGDRTPELLARRAQDGSLAAFAELVGIFETRLFNFILRRTGNWADAEELTQEAFVRAWERIDRYDDRWRFSTWLFTIGSRLAVSRHRSRKRSRSSDSLDLRAAPVVDPATEADRRDARSPTWKLAARLLTESQNTALWLRYAEGLSMREIACVMRRSQVSVRVTLFRARDQLASHILRLRAERERGVRVDDLPEDLETLLNACGVKA